MNQIKTIIENHTTTHFINGHWVTGQGNSFSSESPVDGKVIWHGQLATKNDVQDAVNAAHNALRKWSASSFNQRCEVVNKFAEVVRENKTQLTELISKETGKPLWESATEVSAIIGKIAISIDAYHQRTGERTTDAAGAKGHLRFKPHGVVAVLGPFNFPAHLSNGHIVPALLAGNTVVLKPSELTPAVGEFIIECWEKAGIPNGVINCIQGHAETAKHLINEDIQGVYFTGSYQAGLAINKQLSERPEVILALEMGGNNPLVIDDVQDTTAALYHTAISAFITAGQRCTCARRVLVRNGSQGDAFIEGFTKLSQSILVGPYHQSPEPFMGSVISHKHAQKHLMAQDNLLSLGGRALLKMELLHENTGFLSPGIIDMSEANHPGDMEIFAPLTQIYRYDTLDEAIHLANQTQYGLAAGILTDSAQNYQTFYEEVKAGLINWNRPTTGAASNLPFGGVGHSGNHRASAWFAADYCAYPVSSLEQNELKLPENLMPGVKI